MHDNCENYFESGIHYSEYANGGVVKAELCDTMFDAMDVEMKVIHSLNPKTFFISPFADSRPATDMLMPYSFSGKAKCNTDAGDKPNFDIGAEIARGRCLDKYHRAFDKRMRMFLLDARALVATIEHYCEKAGIDTTSVDDVDKIKSIRFNYGK